uniref:ABC transmembrane type-1 domain-containing protein n=1 Tax=Panagrolaimus sp. ES5 TaxID=591445 RepID=A0AC34EZM9_9BILA
MSIMLALIAFFQYVCFRFVALKVTRRLRRTYFRSALHQDIEFFQIHQSHEFNKSISDDIQKVTASISDTLPAIVTCFFQVAAACVTAYTLTWRLSWVVNCLAIGCGLWVMILMKVKCPENHGELEKLLKRQLHCGTRKGLFQGTLAGSLQLFLFLGMGTGAIYGNWLLDKGLMELPSYIFVCASTLIPAFVRIGQLPSLLVPLQTLPKVGRAMKYVETKVGKTPFKETDVMLEEKRKQFLVSYFKVEVGALPEKLHHHKSHAFHRVRRNAFSHWFLYLIALICCGMMGASAAAVTKMNGNMFEFYNKPDIRIFFYKGAKHAYEYLIVGMTVFICGVIGGALFGYISESSIKKLRELLFECSKNGFIEKDTLMVLMSKYTGPIKGAFDNRLSAFIIGVLSIVCGILSNIHKSLVFSFLTSVAFSLQAVAQFFVFRFADIHISHATKASIKRGIKALHELEGMSETEISQNIHAISRAHNRYLSFTFHKQTSVVFCQALRFTFGLAIPQVTQAFSYSMGSYLVVNKLLAPISVYKIIQTIYTSVGVVATLAQYPHDVYASRISAQKLDDHIELTAAICIEDGSSSRKSSTSSTDSEE